MLTLLLISLFPLLVATNNHPYIIKPLSQSSGLFYNLLGTAQISNSKLTLLSHLNLTYINEGQFVLKRYYVKSLSLCKTAIQDKNQQHSLVSFHCDQTLKIINDQIKEIYKKTEILSHLTGINHNKRTKRGLINGVSYALNWLFGTPSASDAKYYTDSINALLQDNKQTQTLLKSQIQIISSTIRNFNNSVSSLKQNEKKLNENLKLINTFASETSNSLDKLELESLILQHTITLSALANQILSHCNEYIEAINLGKHGILSPQIITPKILYDEISLYKGENELPILPDLENVHVLYKIMELEIFSSNGLIVFVIKIPLVNKNTFNIYQIISLPIQHPNSTYISYIAPQKEFLLLSHTKTLVTLMQGLAGCIEYSTRQYICRGVHTTKRTEQQTCEVMLLNPHLKNIPETCQTRTINAVIETWHYLKHNQWLYVLPKPTTLTLVCGHHIEDVDVHGTGLIQLNQDCKGYTDFIVLETSSETHSNITHEVPGISIIEDDCCIVSKVNVSGTLHLKPVKLTNVDLSELKYADNKLEELDKIITHQLENPISVTHYRWYTILFSIIGALIFIIICGNCCNWFGCGSLIKRLCCFTKNPRNGEVIPPLIKNFVNCTFASDLRNERHHQSRDIVVYENRELAEMRPMAPIAEDADEFNKFPRPSRPYDLRPLNNRRSTTPI